MTETVADLANAAMMHASYALVHRLKDVADTTPTVEVGPKEEQPPMSAITAVPFHDQRRACSKQPLWYVDVYIDDFISLVQGLKHQ